MIFRGVRGLIWFCSSDMGADRAWVGREGGGGDTGAGLGGRGGSNISDMTLPKTKLVLLRDDVSGSHFLNFRCSGWCNYTSPTGTLQTSTFSALCQFLLLKDLSTLLFGCCTSAVDVRMQPPTPSPQLWVWSIWRTFSKGYLINSWQDEGASRLWLLHVDPQHLLFQTPPSLYYRISIFPVGGSLRVSL